MSWFQEYIVSNIWVLILIICVGVYYYNSGFKNGARSVLTVWKKTIEEEKQNE